jgi:hypothetical protein
MLLGPSICVYGELVSFVLFCLFEFGLGISCTYACCIFISCLHLCIIDCICIICFRDVLLLYTLTMICWIRAYDFASDAHEMYSCALGSFKMYMLVDGFFVNMLFMILSCELNASHIQILHLWLYLA